MVIGYFGLPGCGKTTTACKIAQKELHSILKGKSKYKHVYTNFYCKGCEYVNYKDLGSYDFSDSLIVLDELTLDADSRNFKQFDQSHKEFFLLHRHYNIDVVYFTQQYDGIDKKIRDITHTLYYTQKIGRYFTMSKRIYRVLDINDMTKEIVEGYEFKSLLKQILKIQICFMPKYWKYFDSFEIPEKLPDYKTIKM